MSNRYWWSESGSYGQPGEIPGIILTEEEELPPLNRVNQIAQRFLINKEETQASDLCLTWKTEAGVWIILYTKANDPRLKRQYAQYPDKAQSVIDLLKTAASSYLANRERKKLDFGDKLPNVELPLSLQAEVRQIEVWQDFLKEKNGLFSQRYCAQLLSDGYYVIPIAGHALVGPWNTGTEDNDWEEYFYPSQVFDPEGQVPIVQDKAVFWRLEEKKIIIALFHEQATDEVAAHYGYAQSLAAVQQETREAKEREKEYREQSWERHKQHTQEVHAKLVESLLES